MQPAIREEKRVRMISASNVDAGCVPQLVEKCSNNVVRCAKKAVCQKTWCKVGYFHSKVQHTCTCSVGMNMHRNCFDVVFSDVCFNRALKRCEAMYGSYYVANVCVELCFVGATM